MRDLVLFVQFQKREKHPWRSVIFSSMYVFHFFKIVQMVPNRAKHLIHKFLTIIPKTSSKSGKKVIF